MAKRHNIENIYEAGKSTKPAYKITVSPRKLNYKKRADKIIEDLLFHNIRLYKDGKRMPIGSLNLTIMFDPPTMFDLIEDRQKMKNANLGITIPRKEKKCL